MMKTWVNYTLIGAICVVVIGGAAFGVQRWAYARGTAEIAQGGAQNLERGLGHLRLAQALGNRSTIPGYAEAQHSLGVCYQNGEGVPKNYVEAAIWFRRAAEQGYAGAQANLGVRYELGEGVTLDYAEAVKWYRRAAEQGFAAGQLNLGFLYAKGRGVPQDLAEARRWYQRAAEQGLSNAQVNLGACYANSLGVSQDFAEASKWYQKAADQGDKEGQNLLGVCYALGQGVPQNGEEAMKWFRKSAEQGHANAQFNLGLSYQEGKFALKDYAEAKKWYQKAADQGDERAQFNLKEINTKLVADQDQSVNSIAIEPTGVQNAKTQLADDSKLTRVMSSYGISLLVPSTCSAINASANQFKIGNRVSSGIFGINMQQVTTPFTVEGLQALGEEKMKAISLGSLQHKSSSRGTKWVITSVNTMQYGKFRGIVVNAKEDGNPPFPLASSHFYSSFNNQGLDLDIWYFVDSTDPRMIQTILGSLKYEF